MADLLDKLNTLLRANLNSFLSGSGNREEGSRARLTPDKLGGDVDREIAALRKQVDDALRDEDAQRARLDAMQKQLVDLDQEIDQLLERGDDAQARQLAAQLKRQQQKVSIVEADLERHQQATFDLIQHVNTLDAMVSDARRIQAEKADQGNQGDQGANYPPARERSENTPRPTSPIPEVNLTKLAAPEPPRPAAENQGTPAIQTKIPVGGSATPPPPVPNSANLEPPATPAIQTKIPIRVGTSAPSTPSTPSALAQPAPEPMSESDKKIQAAQGHVDKLADVLRDVRQRVETSIAAGDIVMERNAEMLNAAPPKPETSDSNVPLKGGNVNVRTTPSDGDVDADLAKRRARLSKPE